MIIVKQNFLINLPADETKKSKMNNKSKDEEYNKLIGNLRSSIGILAKKIEQKIYEYGFLRE